MALLTPDQVDLENLMLIDPKKGELDGVHDKIQSMYGKDLDFSNLDMNSDGIFLTNNALVVPF